MSWHSVAVLVAMAGWLYIGFLLGTRRGPRPTSLPSRPPLMSHGQWASLSQSEKIDALEREFDVLAAQLVGIPGAGMFGYGQVGGVRMEFEKVVLEGTSIVFWLRVHGPCHLEGPIELHDPDGRLFLSGSDVKPRRIASGEVVTIRQTLTVDQVRSIGEFVWHPDGFPPPPRDWGEL